jgi:hypothetical protein
VCDPAAALNFGGLVNAPAFHQMPPLWAKAQGPSGKQTGNHREGGATRCGAPPRDATGNGEKQMKETLAELEAKLDKITTELAELRAGDKAASGAAEAIAAKEREAEWARALIASAEKDAQIAELRQQIQAKAEKEAEEAIEAAVARGALAAKDHEARARWKKLLAEAPANLVLLQALQGNAALGGSITRGASVSALGTLQAKEGPARILKAYAELAAKNAGITPVGAVNFERKGQLAREMAAIYKREISSRMAEFEGMPLMAADYTDPAGNLGTLSGTLVAQRCLELFKLTFPVLTRITTDFSDLPAQFKQTIATRVVMVPAVQAYDPTPDATGRPKGWSTVSAAQTKDVLVTLDEHVGVPIVFDANTLASTVRRLFDEMAPAAAYALAKYFVEKIYKLFTPANYNAYAKVSGAKVPAALPTFPVGIGDFARSSLTKLAAILNPNEVPIQGRVCLLNSPYFEQLATDPSLVTFFAGQQSPEIVTENRLPKLANFEPIEAPNLNAPNVTPNLVGMALHKAAVVAMTRLSNDYTQALPGSSYGSVTTITDPDLGISVVLVQYVNHTGGYAEWRIQVFLGTAVGDNRGGLCLTSQ